MTARGLLKGEIDAIEFLIAEALGLTLGQVGELPNEEVERWRGFYMARGQKQELAEKVARAHG